MLREWSLITGRGGGLQNDRGGGGQVKFDPYKKGGRKSVSHWKRGGGGAQKVSDPRFSHLIL